MRSRLKKTGILIFTILVIFTTSCRQGLHQSEIFKDVNDDDTIKPDIPGVPIAISDILLEDSTGILIEAGYEIMQGDELIAYPKESQGGEVFIDDTITWHWVPSNGTENLPLIPRADGSLVIPSINTNNSGSSGMIRGVGSEGTVKDFPVIINITKIITLAGPKVVDSEFSGIRTRTSGDYYIIELTATSTGVTPLDFTGANWSSSNESIATVIGFDSSVRVEGRSRGSVTITVETVDGVRGHYEIEVYESMLITWDVAAGTTIELPLMADGAQSVYTWEFLVDWGDGSDVEVLQSADYNYQQSVYPTHTYEIDGSYVVRLFTSNPNGLLPWSFVHASINYPRSLSLGTRSTSAEHLIDVLRFGGATLGYGFFYGAKNLVDFTDTKAPVLGPTTADMFHNASLFNGDISHWDTSKVTSMRRMFNFAYEFDQDIGSWSVGNVTHMGSMFEGAKSFNQNLSEWDISNVEYMEKMFRQAFLFNNGGQPLAWGEKTAKVRDMNNMFMWTNSFNQPIGDWNVSKVENMAEMFRQSALFNQDISGWNVGAVTSMKMMFYNAPKFNNNGKPLFWGSNTAKVESMESTFYGAAAFNQNISDWDLSSVTTMAKMFSFASSFNQDMSTWDRWTKNPKVDYNSWLVGSKISRTNDPLVLPPGFTDFSGN